MRAAGEPQDEAREPTRGEPKIIGEVGGFVDEFRATLGIHGFDLDPDAISATLGCAPTRAHRRGDRQARGPAFTAGAWLLSAEGRGHSDPEAVVRQLLDSLPTDQTVWTELTAEYKVRIGFGIFVDGWNQGFELSPGTMEQLAALGIPVGFDIYCDEGDVA